MASALEISTSTLGSGWGMLLEAMSMEARGRKQIGPKRRWAAMQPGYSPQLTPWDALKLGWPFTVVLSWGQRAMPLSESFEAGCLGKGNDLGQGDQEF